jgi:hypothetical protein
VGEVIKRFEQRGYTLRALKVRLWTYKHNWLDLTQRWEGVGAWGQEDRAVASVQRGRAMLLLRPPAPLRAAAARAVFSCVPDIPTHHHNPTPPSKKQNSS